VQFLGDGDEALELADVQEAGGHERSDLRHCA
jgi:hypothetical protein